MGGKSLNAPIPSRPDRRSHLRVWVARAAAPEEAAAIVVCIACGPRARRREVGRGSANEEG